MFAFFTHNAVHERLCMKYCLSFCMFNLADSWTDVSEIWFKRIQAGRL